VELGWSALPVAVSENTGFTSSVQSGQMAGAVEPRLALRMPATKVP
jgi:hypothetical protein